MIPTNWTPLGESTSNLAEEPEKKPLHERRQSFRGSLLLDGSSHHDPMDQFEKERQEERLQQALKRRSSLSNVNAANSTTASITSTPPKPTSLQAALSLSQHQQEQEAAQEAESQAHSPARMPRNSLRASRHGTHGGYKENRRSSLTRVKDRFRESLKGGSSKNRRHDRGQDSRAPRMPAHYQRTESRRHLIQQPPEPNSKSTNKRRKPHKSRRSRGKELQQLEQEDLEIALDQDRRPQEEEEENIPAQPSAGFSREEQMNKMKSSKSSISQRLLGNKILKTMTTSKRNLQRQSSRLFQNFASNSKLLTESMSDLFANSATHGIALGNAPSDNPALPTADMPAAGPSKNSSLLMGTESSHSQMMGTSTRRSSSRNLGLSNHTTATAAGGRTKKTNVRRPSGDAKAILASAAKQPILRSEAGSSGFDTQHIAVRDQETGEVHHHQDLAAASTHSSVRHGSSHSKSNHGSNHSKREGDLLVPVLDLKATLSRSSGQSKLEGVMRSNAALATGAGSATVAGTVVESVAGTVAGTVATKETKDSWMYDSAKGHFTVKPKKPKDVPAPTPQPLTSPKRDSPSIASTLGPPPNSRDSHSRNMGKKQRSSRRSLMNDSGNSHASSKLRRGGIQEERPNKLPSSTRRGSSKNLMTDSSKKNSRMNNDSSMGRSSNRRSSTRGDIPPNSRRASMRSESMMSGSSRRSVKEDRPNKQPSRRESSSRHLLKDGSSKRNNHGMDRSSKRSSHKDGDTAPKRPSSRRDGLTHNSHQGRSSRRGMMKDASSTSTARGEGSGSGRRTPNHEGRRASGSGSGRRASALKRSESVALRRQNSKDRRRELTKSATNGQSTSLPALSQYPDAATTTLQSAMVQKQKAEAQSTTPSPLDVGAFVVVDRNSSSSKSSDPSRESRTGKAVFTDMPVDFETHRTARTVDTSMALYHETTNCRVRTTSSPLELDSLPVPTHCPSVSSAWDMAPVASTA